MLILKFLYILLQSELARGILFAVAGFQQDVKIFCEKMYEKFAALEKNRTFAVPIRKELTRDPRMTSD